MANENIIHIYDLSVIAGYAGVVRPAMLLLSYYAQAKDARNRVQIRKADLCEIFDVSENCIKKWIAALCRAGAIKYHTNATVFVNPFFSYDGSAAEYKNVVNEWRAFKSKIPAFRTVSSAAQ